VGQHSSASGSALLGLDGLEVLAARVAAGEWQFEVQTTAGGRLSGLRVRAELHDLPCPYEQKLPYLTGHGPSVTSAPFV
jgi:hypothetical protein